MKIDLVFHIFEQYLSLPEIQQLCASTIDQFNHIDVQQFLFHKQLSAFLQPHIAGIQIRPAFLCTQDGLFLFPCIYVFLVPGKQHLRHLFPVPHIRSGILRMFQKLSVERFGQSRLFISKHSRNQACHCIDNPHGCQLAARQYIITDGNVICDHFLKHALINALVMPA